MNRNTINRYFKIIRELIFEKQQRDLSLFFGEIELDEAYFEVKRLCGIYFKSREEQSEKQPVVGILRIGG